MKLILVSLFSTLYVSLAAQTKDTIYYNSDWKVVDKSKALYYRNIKSIESDTIKIIDYYLKTNTPQMIGQFSDTTFTYKIGKFKYFREDGSIKQIGSYNTNGKKTGLWTTYLKNGFDCCVFNYKNGVKDGEGSMKYDNSNFKYISQFKNDELNGWKKIYRRNGSLKKEEELIDGYATGNYKKYSRNGSRTKEVILEQ